MAEAHYGAADPGGHRFTPPSIAMVLPTLSSTKRVSTNTIGSSLYHTGQGMPLIPVGQRSRLAIDDQLGAPWLDDQSKFPSRSCSTIYSLSTLTVKRLRQCQSRLVNPVACQTLDNILFAITDQQNSASHPFGEGEPGLIEDLEMCGDAGIGVFDGSGKLPVIELNHMASQTGGRSSEFWMYEKVRQEYPHSSSLT